MHDDLQKVLMAFPGAVLSGRDGDGWPVSVPCRPRFDPDRQVVRCDRVPGAELGDGPAWLLCHSHDEKLARLRSVGVCGNVAAVGAEWVFSPIRLVPGLGMSGVVGDGRVFVDARRRAGRYLAARGLDRPRVPWRRLRRLGSST